MGMSIMILGPQQVPAREAESEARSDQCARMPACLTARKDFHGIKENRRDSKSKSSNFVRLERDYLLFLLLGDGAFVGNWYGFYSVLSVWVLCDDTSETLLQLLTGLVTFLLCAGRLRVKLMLL